MFIPIKIGGVIPLSLILNLKMNSKIKEERMMMQAHANNALMAGHFNKVKVLLEAGLKPNHTKSILLMHCILEDDLDLLNTLFTKYNAKLPNQWIVDQAIKNKKSGALRILLIHGLQITQKHLKLALKYQNETFHNTLQIIYDAQTNNANEDIQQLVKSHFLF